MSGTRRRRRDVRFNRPRSQRSTRRWNWRFDQLRRSDCERLIISRIRKSKGRSGGRHDQPRWRVGRGRRRVRVGIVGCPAVAAFDYDGRSHRVAERSHHCPLGIRSHAEFFRVALSRRWHTFDKSKCKKSNVRNDGTTGKGVAGLRSALCPERLTSETVTTRCQAHCSDVPDDGDSGTRRWSGRSRGVEVEPAVPAGAVAELPTAALQQAMEKAREGRATEGRHDAAGPRRRGQSARHDVVVDAMDGRSRAVPFRVREGSSAGAPGECDETRHRDLPAMRL